MGGPLPRVPGWEIRSSQGRRLSTDLLRTWAGCKAVCAPTWLGHTANVGTGPTQESSLPPQEPETEESRWPHVPHKWTHLFQLTSWGNTRPSRRVQSSVGS